ncbi:MAG: succinate dehydrogenase, hydrophobic membrane anchor protein [Rickettsiales bacterium]|nr:succinate dehydrogenase, hydrophobic membrane anchor protein [Rickettsiales bacterium]|tara:strand:+ start:208 stop:606 length:399 start_codon:yes stop_codon:yes gene_type:complete
MKKNEALRNPLANARGLGSAKEGSHHWWLQRLSALIIIPTSIWFMYSLLTVLLAADPLDVAIWLQEPLRAVVLTIMLGAMFFHAKLGLQVVIEDYVHKPLPKYVLLIGNNFLFLTIAATSLFAIIKLHIYGI